MTLRDRIAAAVKRKRSHVPEAWIGDSASLDEICAHIEKHVGSPKTVIHELASQHVHIDVHVVEPTPERNYYTLVTSGMSDRPMQVPTGAEHYRFAELVLSLPPDWPLPLDYEITTGMDWPIDGLRHLARMAHQYNTWLGWGHTIPNGDPPQAFGPDTEFCCFVLLRPKQFGQEFQRLVTKHGKPIYFWSAVPMYREEVDLKLSQGAEAIERLFDGFNITELVDPNRVNVARVPQ